MSRRGVAIFLVLVVLVVAVTAAANVARVSVAGMTGRRIADDTRIADDLLIQAEIAAHAWLASASGAVMLPPDADRPSLTILDDVVHIEEQAYSITITAVDLFGMPRMWGLTEFGFHFPPDVADELGSMDVELSGTGPDMIDRSSVGRTIYPVPRHGPRAVFGEEAAIGEGNPGGRSRSFDPLASKDSEVQAPPSVCELVAFVRATPPRRLDREQTDNALHPINVNTAPLALLNSVLSRAGHDVIDGIIRARTEGKPAVMNIIIDEDYPVRLVSRSTLWGFRCDVQTGSVSKSHWIVFEQAGGAWRLVRRIMIDA